MQPSLKLFVLILSKLRNESALSALLSHFGPPVSFFLELRVSLRKSNRGSLSDATSDQPSGTVPLSSPPGSFCLVGYIHSYDIAFPVPCRISSELD